MKKYLKYIVLFLIFISSIIFMNNNHALYKNPIMKVTNIEIDKTENYKNDNLNEVYYYETITGRLLNGLSKNKTIEVSNIRTFSGVYDNTYSLGDEVFVNDSLDEIISLRRDKYLIPLFVLMVVLLIMVGNIKGIYTLISLIINIVIIYLVTVLRDKNISVFLLFIPASIIMCMTSLLLTSGFNKKSMVAILSSIISIFITFLISYIVILIFNGDIPYWYMDYVDILYDYKEIFLVSILISGLGAIMDVAISISSTLNELITNNHKISIKSLKNSGISLSSDIMGTMVNVLLFTSISGSIPMIIFVMRNNIRIFTALNMYGKIPLLFFMSGCLGIIITIPITIYLSIYFYKRRAK